MMTGRYREEYETDVVLRDGRSLHIRPLRRDDAERLRRLLAGASRESLYFRFHHVVRDPAREAARLVEGLDGGRYLGLVATAGEGEREEAVALAQAARADAQAVAEAAFLVAERYQGLGVGTHLLEHLALVARDRGVRVLRAEVLGENARMLDVFRESGFHERTTAVDGVVSVELRIDDWDEFAARSARRDHLARAESIRRILEPRSVAVIGASNRDGSVGAALMDNLLTARFQGPVYPVNPTSAAVHGVRAYPSVLDVPDPVDLAVIAVRADRVLEVVDGCADKGVKGLVVISAGFREIGGEGMEREADLRRRARAAGMRLVGPNCLGIMNTHPDVRLNATFAATVSHRGNVAIGSHSGALALALLDHARTLNIGVSSFASVGNRADVSSNDLLEYWEEDPSTEVVLLYVESFGNPRKFSRIVRRLSRKKPVIAMKSGRSVAGARAAASHTGALATSDTAVDALFRQAGVVRVDTIEDLFDAAAVLAHQPPPRGRRVAVLTNAGGPGVLAADAAEAHGLEAPALSGETQASLREFLPPAAAVRNPVDMLAEARPDAYEKGVRLLLDAPDADALLAIYIPPLVTTPEEVAAAMRRATSGYAGPKPVLACFLTARGAPPELQGDSGRAIPSFAFPEDAIRTLAKLARYAEGRDTPPGKPLVFTDVDPAAARSLVREALADAPGGDGWLAPEVVARLLETYRIPVVKTEAVKDIDEAQAVAERTGYPVALKVRSSSIVHKTDVGGVALGLADAGALREAHRRMVERLREQGLAGRVEGWVVQPMAPQGMEVIVGSAFDPLFGPLVAVGLGGVNVELFKDLAFRLQPLTDRDVSEMLRSLRCFPLLTGWRGAARRDVAALEETLARFAALVEGVPEIVSVDMNPVVVGEEGQGCVVVDARVRATRSPEVPLEVRARGWR